MKEEVKVGPHSRECGGSNSHSPRSQCKWVVLIQGQSFSQGIFGDVQDIFRYYNLRGEGDAIGT